MRKRILCLAMTVVMVVGAQMTAFAKDYQGKDGWQAEFDGKELKTNFESTALADEAVNVQPGDSITLKVRILNSVKDETDWYMSNEVIKTLEDDKAAAAGGAYEYRLTYTGSSSGETVLYDSETVGGDEANPNGEGLHETDESLKDFFFLERLAKDGSGVVSLTIKVDGETQGNGYQETLAKLQMNFAVEKVAPGKKTVITTIVKTGDTSKALLFSGLALASGIVLLIFGLLYLKKNRNEDPQAQGHGRRHHRRKGE